MGYHVTIVPRDGKRPLSVEQVSRAIESVEGLTWSIFDHRTINVNGKDGEWQLSIFETEGVWWSKTLDEDQLDKFLAIAEALNCDVEGDEGELYRSVDGSVAVIREPPPQPAPLLPRSLRGRGSPRMQLLIWIIGALVTVAFIWIRLSRPG